MIASATNRWRYSGKEEQGAALNPALSLIDYGARMYDPAIARWMSVDPLAEKYYNESVLSFCTNNPLIFIDSDGRDRSVVIDDQNKTITIRATYHYPNSLYRTEKALEKAVEFYNSLNLSCQVKGVSYSVVFQLKEKGHWSNKKERKNNPDSPNNYVNHEKKEFANNALAETWYRTRINIKDETVDAYIMIHEIGHTLGALDKTEKDDFMYEHYNLGVPMVLSQESLNEIIEGALFSVTENKKQENENNQ